MPRLPQPQFEPDCTIRVEGKAIPARAGESVAEALLAAGRTLVSRSAKYHRPRGAFCLRGSCGSCMMRIDGVPNQRACRVACRDGLEAKQQNVFPTAEHDVFGAIDWLFPGGLEHHTLMVQSTVANQAAQKVARQLAGLGTLPSEPAAPLPSALRETYDAAVIGGGPAGLAAAEVLAKGGRRILLLEQDRVWGGRLRCQLRLPDDPPLSWATDAARAVLKAGGKALLASQAIGIWSEHDRPLLGVLTDGDAPRLRLVKAARLVICAGGHPQPPPFENNDLPGIFSGRGIALAYAERGIVPGKRCLVVGRGEEPRAIAELLSNSGAGIELIAGTISRARGRARLRGVIVGADEPYPCDALAYAAPPAPAFELARQAGAWVKYSAAMGAFAVEADANGATGAPGVFAAGEIAATRGWMSAAEAAAMGRRAGEAALQ